MLSYHQHNVKLLL